MAIKGQYEITEIHVFSPGDPSVGIHDYYEVLTGTSILDLEVLDEEDVKEAVEEFREDLRKTFEKQLDGPVSITFDID